MREYKVMIENGTATKPEINNTNSTNSNWIKNSKSNIEGYVIVSANSQLEAIGKAQKFANKIQ